MDDFWWKASKEEAGDKAIAACKAIEEAQWKVHLRNKQHARLYDPTSIVDVDWQTSVGAEDGGAVTDNLIAEGVDALHNLIARTRPRPVPITENGSWSQKRRAKKLGRFLEGVYEKSNVYEEAAMMVHDGLVFGTGAMKTEVEEDGDEVNLCAYRVFIGEIVVDENECRTGALPRTLYQRRPVDIDIVKGMFEDDPDYEKIAVHLETIRNTDDTRMWTSYLECPHNQVVLTEAWHLPSSKKAKDGRRVLAVPGMTLEFEEYDEDDFPFVFWRFKKRTVGFYGKGIPESGIGKQNRMNKLNRTFEAVQDHLANPFVAVPYGSKIIKSHFTDGLLRLLYYRGNSPPSPMAFGEMPSHMLNQREVHRRNFKEELGVSVAAVTGGREPGIEAGVAIREVNDNQNQRHALALQSYEEIIGSKLAWKLIRLAKKAHKGKRLAVTYKARKFVQTIDWKEVDPENDSFSLSVEPGSFLTRTPAGRLQAVSELGAAGWLTPEQGLALLELPDVTSETSILLAAKQDVDRVIEELEEGNFIPPEPSQFLLMAKERVHMAGLRAKADGAPMEVYELFLRWVQQADSLLKRMAQGDPGLPFVGPQFTPPPPPGQEAPPNQQGA